MLGGIRPYAIGIRPQGDVAVIGTQGGGTRDNDIEDIADLKSKPPRIVNSITVGPQVEGVAMAPDGRFVVPPSPTIRTRPSASLSSAPTDC